MKNMVLFNKKNEYYSPKLEIVDKNRIDITFTVDDFNDTNRLSNFVIKQLSLFSYAARYMFHKEKIKLSDYTFTSIHINNHDVTFIFIHK